MKKSIISILLVFALSVSFAACKKIPDDVYVETPTNENGEIETTIPAELEDFLSSFDTSDPAEIQQQFEQMLDEEAVDVELEFGDAPIDDSDSEKIEVELNDKGEPDRSELQNNYMEIMSGDEFTVDVVIRQSMEVDGKEEEVNVPMYMTRSGDKLFVKMTAPYNNQGTITLNMLKTDDGKLYFIIPSMRAYMLFTEEEIGEIDLPLGEYIQESMNSAESTSKYVETRQVEVNGKTYDCDIYQDGDIITKNYFKDDGLKRVETIDAEGKITIIEINTVDAKADKSKFKTPTNYFNMTSILKDSAGFTGVVTQ